MNDKLAPVTAKGARALCSHCDLIMIHARARKGKVTGHAIRYQS